MESIRTESFTLSKRPFRTAYWHARWFLWDNRESPPINTHEAVVGVRENCILILSLGWQAIGDINGYLDVQRAHRQDGKPVLIAQHLVSEYVANTLSLKLVASDWRTSGFWMNEDDVDTVTQK